MPKQGEKMYRVYTVVPRPKQEDYWLNIGAAFPHDDGKNLNCILQAHPSGEKIVLREYEPKDAQAAGETESTKDDAPHYPRRAKSRSSRAARAVNSTQPHFSTAIADAFDAALKPENAGFTEAAHGASHGRRRRDARGARVAC